MIKILWSKHVLVSICVYAVFLFLNSYIYIWTLKKNFLPCVLYIYVLFPHLSFFLYTSSTSVKTWSAASDDNLSTKCTAYTLCTWTTLGCFFSPGKPLLQGLLLMMTICQQNATRMYVHDNSRLFFSPGKTPANSPGKTTRKALD